MKQKTITINVPEPGDALPFTVLETGKVRLYYDRSGCLQLYPLSAEAVAKALDIPVKVSSNTLVGGVEEYA